MKKSIKIIVLGVLSIFLSACQKPADDAAIIEAAKAGYTAFQQGDMAAWAATQASDVEWIAPKSLPYAGSYFCRRSGLKFCSSISNSASATPGMSSKEWGSSAFALLRPS